MHVLVLHQHYWPEIAATAQILSDLCEDLVAMGHEVTVVCGQPSYRMIDGLSRLPSKQMHRGVRIERVWSYTPSRRGIPQRLAHYVSYFGSSLIAAVARGKPDVCLVMSTPPLLLGISGSLLRVTRGVPFIYSVQDIYPDIAIHLGMMPAGGSLARAIGAIATQSYRAATAVVTLSLGMAGSLVARGVAAQRVHVIPNWADTDSLKPMARDNELARELGLAPGFVVLYSGNLGQSQGLDQVVEAAQTLRELPITFAFVGDGNARAHLEALVRNKSLTNVRFLPPQPRERLSDLLSGCDVGLVTMRKGIGDDLVPSKLYGIMAASRPVLASVESSSEVARVIREHSCGHVAAPESGHALAESVRLIFAASQEERSVLGRNGRSACVRHFSRVVLTQRYEEVLRGAAEQSASFAATTSTGASRYRPPSVGTRRADP